jgi:hypothetical protein
MVSPFRGDGPFRGRGPFLGRGPWAGRGPGGFNVGIPFAIDATGEHIRAAISDPTAYASGGYLLRGLGGARLNASARASVAMQQASDGTYEYAAHNLLLNSVWAGGVAPTSWTPELTVAATVAEAGTNAKLSWTATADRGYLRQTVSVAAYTTYTASVYVDSVSAGLDRRAILSLATGPAGSTITGSVAGDAVAGEFIKARIDVGATAGTVNLRCGIGTNGNATGTVVLHRPQVSVGPTALPYVPTTSAAVYAPAVDWLSAQSAYGLRSEAAATNRALWARDLTNAAWTKTNATAALTATGIDGVANSASVVTATAGNATVLQAITHASEARTLSIFLKRRTGAGTVETTIDGGSTWVARTLTSDWQRFTTTSTLADPSVGIRIVTSGDAVDVDAAQVETGSRASSPILTLGATATRAADALVVPDSGWINQTEGTLAAVAVRDAASTTGFPQIATLTPGSGTADVIRLGYVTPTLAAFDVRVGNVAQAEMYPSATTDRRSIAARYAVNDFAVSVNGGAVSTDTSGTLPTTAALTVGSSSVSGAQALNGHITRIRYVGRRLSDGQLRALTE